jgi:TetR/AcrR family transcriptional regulator, transcriptional repressor for nem operon
VPRTAEFDPRQALDKAMLLFWKKGYGDTSIDDLVGFTGVSRYGLYGTFGSKHDLFLAALDNYRDGVIAGQLQKLETNGAGWKEIRLFFEGLSALAKMPEGRLGCLMCNTSTEVAPHDQQVALKVEAHIKRLQKAFQAALEQAQKRGELTSTIHIIQMSNFLVGVAQGIFALSRAAENAPIIEHFCVAALNSIEQ